MIQRGHLGSCILALVACGGGASTPERAAARSSEAKPEVAPKLEAPPPAAPEVCAAAERHGGDLHWFDDDYAGALACARAKGVPLVLDLWAPWCHTCLSMQAYVLTDPRLADADRRFVFAALDTDREANAPVVARFPPQAWPTFFVVSSVDESIATRFVGAATVEQFQQFLADGERAARAVDDDALPAHEAAARRGDRGAARKQWAEAAEAYGVALAQAPADWVRGPDVMVSLIAARVRGESWDRCAEVVDTYLGKTGSSASATDFSVHTLACAAAQTDAARTAALREAVVQRLAALVDDAAAPLSIDDRADAMSVLRNALDALGRKDEARTIATRQRKLLDDAVAHTSDPRETMMYNWPRAEVYAYLGVPLELVAALERNARELPDEYDPPYRLAWLLLQAGKPDDARAWAETAAAKAYGPRKARAQGLLADVAHARGDVEAERAARAAVVATLESLPVEARNPEALDKARKDLDALAVP